MTPRIQDDRLPDGTRLQIVSETNTESVGMAVHVRIDDHESGGRDGLCAMAARCLGKESGSRTRTLLRGEIESGSGFGVDLDPFGIEAWVGSPADPAEIARAARLLLLDTLANPIFAPDTVAAARKSFDVQSKLIHDHVPGRALATGIRRALGWGTEPTPDPADLGRIGPAQIDAFHRGCFVPERTSIVVCGRVDVESMRTLVRSLLAVGDWGTRPRPKIRPSTFPEPSTSRPRDIVLPRGAGLGFATLTWVGPGSDSGPGSVADAAVLDALVGDGKGSRLFAERERDAIGYELRSRWMPGPRRSLMQWWCLGSAPGTELRDRMLRVAADLAQNRLPPTNDELDRARGLYLGRRRTIPEHPVWRARRRAVATGIGMSQFDDNPGQWVGAVDTGRVANAAARWFSAPPTMVRTD